MHNYVKIATFHPSHIVVMEYPLSSKILLQKGPNYSLNYVSTLGSGLYKQGGHVTLMWHFGTKVH